MYPEQERKEAEKMNDVEGEEEEVREDTGE